MNVNNNWVDVSESDLVRYDKKISVVIPAYKPEHLSTVLNNLESIPEIMEIIIVDDFVDNELILEKKYQIEVKVVKHKKNMGRAAARNTGAAYSKGDYILFLDQDMILNPRFCSYAMNLNAVNEGRGIILGLRNNIEYNKSLENGIDFSVLSTFGDWRRNISLKNELVDLTCLQVGAVDNNCKTEEVIDIYSMTNGLREMGIVKEKTIGFWDLASMVISHSLFVPKDVFFEIGGFPEWIIGWGGEDIAMGYYAIKRGIKIIMTEIVSAQIIHLPYSGSEEQKIIELKRNICLFHERVRLNKENKMLERYELIKRGKINGNYLFNKGNDA